jgi:hypothetical protein
MEMLLEFLFGRETGLLRRLRVLDIIRVFFDDIVVQLGQVLNALDDFDTAILLLLLVLFFIEGVGGVNGDGTERVDSIRRGTFAGFVKPGMRMDGCPVFWEMC